MKMFKSFCIKDGESSPITDIVPEHLIWISQVEDPSIIRSSVVVTAEDLGELLNITRSDDHDP